MEKALRETKNLLATEEYIQVIFIKLFLNVHFLILQQGNNSKQLTKYYLFFKIGLRPYPCTHCGKKFGRKDHLKKHTRTHQRPMYNASAGMIGLGNPFHPYNPSLIPSHSTINEFGSPSSPFALPFMLSIPPPISHFPFS